MKRSNMWASVCVAILWCSTISKSLSQTNVGDRQLHRRYIEFDPPEILPEDGHQTVKAGSEYSVRCQGKRQGVSWRLPVDARDDLRDRVNLSHKEEINPKIGGGQTRVYIADMTIRDLKYKDTGTFICTYNGTVDTSSIDNSSSVHLYVDDGKHLMKNSGMDFLQAVQYETLILPCQPTHPEVNVTLIREGSGTVQMDKFVSFDPKVGFRISPVTLEQHSGAFRCEAKYRDLTQIYAIQLQVLMETAYVPPPYINRTLARQVQLGHTFTLVCSVTIDTGVMVELSWTTPNSKSMSTRRLIVPDQISRNLSMGNTQLRVIERSLTIHQATLDDQGSYVCEVTDHSENRQRKSEFVRILEKEEPFLRTYYEGFQTIEKMEDDKDIVRWVLQIESHPKPAVVWYAPSGELIPDPNYPSNDLIVRNYLETKNSHTMLQINKLSLENAGTYRVRVTNGYRVEEKKFTLFLRAAPKVSVSIEEQQKLYQIGHEYTATCTAKGSPPPKINWLFKPCTTFTTCDNKGTKSLPPVDGYGKSTFSDIGRESTIKLIAHRSGQIICQACNEVNCQYKFLPFFVTDVPKGFSVEGPRKVMEGDHIKLRCSASVYNYTLGSIQWLKHTVNGDETMSFEEDQVDDFGHYKLISTSTDWSFTEELVFPNVSIMDRGRYKCRVKPKYKNPMNGPRPNYLSSPTASRRHSYLSDEDASNGLDLSYYNDFPSSSADDSDSSELSMDLSVLPLKLPVITHSDLKGDQTIVLQSDDGLRLRCLVDGRPKPQVSWTLNGKPVNLTTNTSRVQLDEGGQVLLISYFAAKDEGMYECSAENKIGHATARQIVVLQSTTEKDAIYANISIPVIIAVIIALLLVVILIILAKLCYRKRKPTWKEPPTPPTPRLTQYELPQNEEDEECRMTLTSTTRDGSISPYNHYGFTRGPPSIISNSHCHCHYGPPSVCPSQMGTLPHGASAAAALGTLDHHSSLFPKCSICDFSAQTLPMNRMMTLRRYDHNNPRSRSHSPVSPRLSAEF
ncbi:vascular endothelial growth factor receptor 1-like [Tigriopus californicus]|uniref:vascular endothelial growth factor receptor 1-like n=1 Tax=Tigriopus californicus TaxID=6832 RepID=UPI0027DA0D0B|nr:vascular endothelial growth factor receptor 1-like [Tigriopus californicus]